MIHTLALLIAAIPSQDLYAEVKAKHAACFKDHVVDMKTWRPYAIEVLKKADFGKMSGEELFGFYELNLFTDLPGPDDDDLQAAFGKMLMARSDEKLPDTLMKFMFIAQRSKPEAVAEIARLWANLTATPRLQELMKSKYAAAFLDATGYYVGPSVIKASPKSAESLYAAMPKPWPLYVAPVAETLWNGIFSEANIGKDNHESARLAAVDVLGRAIQQEKGPRALSFLTGSYGRLTGAAATGKLIGSPVKGMTMIWSSDPKITKIEDLRGRVVVLDFWATWCGPCIASMPKLKETVAAYKDYAVTVLGITSVQGNVIGLEDKPIDVTGKPDEEFALMRKYIEKKEITWPIVFTKEDVYNPEFGVRGIPYTAIIDPAGKVRYTNLHPGNDHEKIEKLINALLLEFKLPAPSGG